MTDRHDAAELPRTLAEHVRGPSHRRVRIVAIAPGARSTGVEVASIESAESGPESAGVARIVAVGRTYRRDELQMLAVLLGILGVVLVLAVTVGAPPA